MCLTVSHIRIEMPNDNMRVCVLEFNFQFAQNVFRVQSIKVHSHIFKYSWCRCFSTDMGNKKKRTNHSVNPFY